MSACGVSRRRNARRRAYRIQMVRLRMVTARRIGLGIAGGSVVLPLATAAATLRVVGKYRSTGDCTPSGEGQGTVRYVSSCVRIVFHVAGAWYDVV